MSELVHCPTCGAPVAVISGDDGTSHYMPIAVEQLQAIVDAAIAHGVNDEVAEAIAHAELVMGMRKRS
jgi:hypothetical protein